MPTDLIRVEYGRTGKSAHTDEMGMREMQARAFESREQQYLLIKAPPASGKSRALMFIGLDKLVNQGVDKAIVAVPERSIGASFKNTALSENGFFADWEVRPDHNLCTAGSDAGKVDAFARFIESRPSDLSDRTLVCTHATLRFAYDRVGPEAFNGTVVAIDEFHHVSADEENRLGALIDGLMHHSTAHVVAMTGSYFRGDTVPILQPDDEELFDKVTYTYYEQLNGYEHLKSLGIGYHFYQGCYLDAVTEVLDTDRKTLIHIPNVNSAESTTDKYGEVDAIIDAMGDVDHQDPDTGLLHVRRHSDRRMLKVANLVEDELTHRTRVMDFLRTVSDRDDVDVIIALGMAKEGFDWPWCEHVLTIGYRRSMTEVVQIIGRATRDAPGKTHAQFTNLIAQPDAEDDDVKNAVNNMLKAITVSLLMEQVMAPTFRFRPRERGDAALAEPGTIQVGEEGGPPPSKRVLDTLNASSDDIIAELHQREDVATAAVDPGVADEYASQVALPAIIRQRHPDLSEDEVEHVRTGIQTQLVINTSGGLIDEADLPEDAKIAKPDEPCEDEPCEDEPGEDEPGEDEPGEDEPGSVTTTPTGAGYDDETVSDPPPSRGESTGNRQFVKMGDRFINIEDLNINMIDAVNPFRGAFEVLSKSVTATMLKTIQDVVQARRIQMSEEEAVILWPKIKAFKQQHGREPSPHSHDPMEVRFAEALSYLRNRKREQATAGSA
ncbi:DEAD/DEAH box helicase [Thioalkalivibrio sp. ALE19]|uniref:DEAD/DEAH box helicase n=1 Tax=Thioalkalivibrio sp. ALE19 TaxID=1266909 RepID=UPI000407AD02|nr:helicase-related protein [Thioalkalivibrio sp. ALE19]